MEGSLVSHQSPYKLGPVQWSVSGGEESVHFLIHADSFQQVIGGTEHPAAGHAIPGRYQHVLEKDGRGTLLEQQ